jgi:hypothetical protein
MVGQRTGKDGRGRTCITPRDPRPSASGAPARAGDKAETDEGFSDEQMHDLATAEEDVDERMREIQRIAKSVEDLAVLFKELATLVVEQGTILDRIDYNMEQVRPAVGGETRSILGVYAAVFSAALIEWQHWR